MSSDITRIMIGDTGSAFAAVSVDASGRLVVAGSGNADVDAPGAAFASRVANTGAARLLQVQGKNVSASTIFVHIFDAASLPANGTAPDVHPIELGAGAEFSISWNGFLFATGITLAASSTQDTLTVSGTSDLWAETEIQE